MAMESQNTRVLNLNYFSINFPGQILSEIRRENVIAGIEKLFDTDINFVVISGEEGLGKTTILKQFAEKNSETTISSFLNPFKEIYSSAELLLNDLYYQVYWLINQREISEAPQVDLEKYRDLYFTLKRERKRKNQDITFLVDGFEHLKDEKIVSGLLSLLPIGEEGFNVLVSGSDDVIKRCLQRAPAVRIISYPLTSFGVEETSKFFSGLEPAISESDVSLLWQAANKGNPSRLHAFKIAIQEKPGIGIGQFLDEVEQMSDIHELDLEQLNRLANPLATNIIKFISVDENVYTVRKLARLLNVSEIEVEATLQKVRFVDKNNKGEILFSSLGCKRFFARAFSEFRDEVIKGNIDYYTERRAEPEALLQLPSYYVQDKDYDSLVQLLNEDYFSNVLKVSQSVAVVHNLVTTGYKAAKKAQNDLKQLTFSLYGSLIENIEGLHVWQSELEARIELGDYDNAISLANSALLKEDRLQMLARIAKVIKRKGEVVEEVLIDQIRQLYQAVDFGQLEEKALDISADLFYSIPSLAIDLIKAYSSKNSSSWNDLVLAKLAIRALQKDDLSVPSQVTSLISDPKVKEVSNSLAYLFGKVSGDEILKEAKKFEEPRDRLIFLRIWIRNNHADPNLKAILEYAIAQMVESSSKEVPTGSLLCDISEALIQISDRDAVTELAKVLLTFQVDAQKLNTQQDYYRFILNLFRALVRVDYNRAFGLFFDLNKGIEKISDLVTRLECLCLLSKCLSLLDVDLNKSHTYLPETLRSNAKNLAIDICRKTAYHYDNLKDSVESISEYDPQFAVELSLKANTFNRRNRLLISSWVGYISGKTERLDLKVLRHIHDSIEGPEHKDMAMRIYFQVTQDKDPKGYSDPLVLFLKAHLHEISSLSERCYCIVMLIKIVLKNEKLKSHGQSLIELLDQTWQSLDTDILKIEVGFLIAGDLASVHRNFAERYLKLADEIKKEIWTDSINTIIVYSSYIRLLIRIYCGLIKGKQNTEDHFRKIEQSIESLPSVTVRIDLWSYFAFFCNYKGEQNLRERIVTNYIRPGFDGLTDSSLKGDILTQLAPLFYLHTPISAIEAVKALPFSKKEDAFRSIIRNTTHDSFPGEAFEDGDKLKKPPYEQLLDCIKLIEFLEEDANVYFAIEDVVKIIADPKVYSAVQRENVRNQIAKLIEDKLPNSKFIKHPGFKVVGMAQLMRFDKDAKHQEQVLLALLKEVETDVDNMSDRSFIYIIIAELIPSIRVKSITQNDLVTKALKSIESVGCDIEFVNRIDMLSREIQKLSPSLWKPKVKDAFERTVKNHFRDNSYNLQRRLIDNAYKHDPDFAKSLMALLDTDESRVEHRKSESIKEHYQMLEIKKKISDEKLSGGGLIARQVAEASWKSLASLNSGLLLTKKTAQLRDLIEYAVDLPIKESQQIYAYYLQNILKRQEDSSDLPATINATFNTIFSICKTIELISKNYKNSNLKQTRYDTLASSGFVAKVGDRDRAIRYLKEWLSKNEDTKYIKIADPYFSKDDLEFVTIVLEQSKDIEVQILTSTEKVSNSGTDVPQQFSIHWRGICQQEPPLTRVTVVSMASNNKSPFHDRWIFAEKSGLRLGTSFNSIGISKDSEISEMDSKEKIRVELEVFEMYFQCKARERKGDKVNYNCFTVN